MQHNSRSDYHVPSCQMISGSWEHSDHFQSLWNEAFHSSVVGPGALQKISEERWGLMGWEIRPKAYGAQWGREKPVRNQGEVKKACRDLVWERETYWDPVGGGKCLQGHSRGGKAYIEPLEEGKTYGESMGGKGLQIGSGGGRPAKGWEVEYGVSWELRRP